MMRINYLLLLILLGAVCPSYSQLSKIDSLKNSISLQKSDSTKVKLLFLLSDKLEYEEAEQAKFYTLQAITLAEKINYKTGIAKGNINLAYLLMNKNHYALAKKSIEFSMSIYTELNDYHGISKSYNALASICSNWHYDYDSAIILYDLSYALCDSIDNKKEKANIDYSRGYTHFMIGNNKKSIEYYNKALVYYKSTSGADNYWDVWNSIGMVYDGMSFYDEALKYYLMALDVAVESVEHKSSLINLYNNIAIVYDNIGNNEKSYQYYMKAFDIVRAIGDKEWEALLYNNLTYIELNNKDTTKAIEYWWKAIKIYNTLEIPCVKSYPYEGLGKLYFDSNKIDSAYYYLKLAEEDGEKCQDKYVLTSIYLGLGKIYEKRKKHNISLNYFKKSLASGISTGNRNDIKESYLSFSNYYENKGDFSKSLEYHKKYVCIKDSIFSSESSDIISKLTASYEFKKEKRLIELENEKASLQMSTDLEKEELNRNTILIILLLTLIIVGTLIRAYFIIKQRNGKLTAMNKEKNTLIGVVAHDLRSPLNNMKGLIPIIRNDNDKITKNQNHYLDLIDQSTTRMSSMINRILDVNAIESQKIHLKIEESDITEILENTIQSFDASLKKKNISIYKNYEKEKNHEINIDKNYLFQVFENIISNAIKFSDSGTKIYLSVKLEHENVVASIMDQGPGIKECELKLLFQQYQKLTARPTANESSTGLGLSHAKKYVEAMDGKIWCESTVGKGSTFLLSFKAANKMSLNSALFSL
jgi:signal transduction histidine kinase/uncharacterized protein HemY